MQLYCGFSSGKYPTKDIRCLRLLYWPFSNTCAVPVLPAIGTILYSDVIYLKLILDGGSIITYDYINEIEKEEVDISNAFNIYISGIDVEGSISKNSRSDVNIIMTINPDTHQILLTTTPRDFYVEIPGVSGGAKDKLTHAGVYGVDASMRTLEQLYGIDGG